MSQSSSIPRAGKIALLTVGALTAGALGYAVYFDYMRRNSAEFRKGLSECHQRRPRPENAPEYRCASAREALDVVCVSGVQISSPQSRVRVLESVSSVLEADFWISAPVLPSNVR